MSVLIRHRSAGMTPEMYDEISPPLVEAIENSRGSSCTSHSQTATASA